MYRVEKTEGKIVVFDNNNKCVYSAVQDSYVLHQSSGVIQVSAINKMTDGQLLTALASAIKLSLE